MKKIDQFACCCCNLSLHINSTSFLFGLQFMHWVRHILFYLTEQWNVWGRCLQRHAKLIADPCEMYLQAQKFGKGQQSLAFCDKLVSVGSGIRH